MADNVQDPVSTSSDPPEKTPQEERIEEAFLALIESIEREDEYIRLQQLRQFKKNNLFWHGFQYLFWSDIDQDWRIPTHEQFEEISSREETRWVFDYVINIFKAHGESIIAALSSDIPDVRFGPKDAQDPDDNRAVEAADNCVELIEKWNRAKLQIINALFYLITEGFVASYTYNKKDMEFGSVSIPEYGEGQISTCPLCGYADQGSPLAVAPGSVVPQVDNNAPGPQLCPQCQAGGIQSPMQPENVPVLQGERLVPKGREVIEIYGPLNVRVPAYVTKQADAGWLVHYVDADPALFKEAFPDIADQIDIDPGQNYERIMRQSSLSMDGFQLNIRLTTQKRVWLRPWMLRRLDHTFDDITPTIRKLYPNGQYFSCIGSVICEKRDESMDKHWTLTKAGPSKGLHADPTLQSLVPIQEIKNNLENLFLMQVEYGVPATYADTEVFDFEGQSKQESAPGYIYPVNPQPGQSISDAFYSEKTTGLNKESTQLLETLNTDGQFVIGSFPSIYGGPAQSGSKTLGEYDKSRNFALQRLSLLYYFVNVWWAETMHKSVLSFIDHQIEDEPITGQVSPGQFQTKWIRKANFKGSFDRLEPEASADFPASFSQKRSILMALLQLNNPEINSVLFHPDNAGIVQSYVGLTELHLPQDVPAQQADEGNTYPHRL